MAMKHRSLWTGLLLSALLLGAGGCGAGSNTTPDEEAAYRDRGKSGIKAPPPGAMKPPSDFKSSLSGEGQGGPPPQGQSGG
jgi:hypothetical protein